jgi:Putative prokaryotic signal transducing protein
VSGGRAAGSEGSDEQLICPSCSRAYPDSERFCPTCGMPLVHPSRGEQQTSPRQRHARKIKPQYAEGELVVVARAQNQSEAEFIEGLLLEEGIPSMARRSPGFEVAEMLAAGPRDVLVPASGAQAAREALAWESPPREQAGGRGDGGGGGS